MKRFKNSPEGNPVPAEDWVPEENRREPDPTPIEPQPREPQPDPTPK